MVSYDMRPTSIMDKLGFRVFSQQLNRECKVPAVATISHYIKGIYCDLKPKNHCRTWRRCRHHYWYVEQYRARRVRHSDLPLYNHFLGTKKYGYSYPCSAWTTHWNTHVNAFKVSRENLVWKSHNIHNRRAQYKEFIFRENPIAAPSRVTNLIEKASDQIHSLHALPFICTIPPSSLDTWNHIRLKQHKTAMLQFFPTYPQMQNNLIETILSINTYIIAINQSKHAFTPKLADTITKNWQKQGA